MSSSDQDDWISELSDSGHGRTYGPNHFRLAGLPVLDQAAIEAHTDGSPQSVDQFKTYLAPIKVLIWNWFDANRERKLGTFKVIVFNFTLRVKHCEALIELILGPRV